MTYMLFVFFSAVIFFNVAVPTQSPSPSDMHSLKNRIKNLSEKSPDVEFQRVGDDIKKLWPEKKLRTTIASHWTFV